MSRFIYTLIIAVGSLAVASCDESYSPVEHPTGQVDLSGVSVSVKDDPLVIESRAGEDLTDYIVTVAAADGSVAGEWSYGTMPQSLTLEEGRYTLTVMSHRLEPAEWSHPYFQGTKAFSVTAGETTQLGEVVCSFASVKVSIRYSDELLKRVGPDACVEVSCGQGASLTYSVDEARAGYFAPAGSLIATFRATVKSNPVEFRRVFGDVAAGQHRIITFSVKTGDGVLPDQTGGVDVQAWIDATMMEETVDGNLTLDEEEVIPDGGGGDGDADAITFQSQTIDFDGVNGVDGDNYVVTIGAPAGLSHLNVAIGTDNDNFMAAVSDLLPVSFDLAYPAGRDEDFKALGLPVGSEVIGATMLNVDISQFVPLLAAYPGRHTFTLDVADMAGNTARRLLTFVSR